MLPYEGLSQPVRRVLSEWLSRLIERLVQFQYQLRHGLIRIISSSVAETIENRLQGPRVQRHSYASNDDDEYLEYEDDSYQPPPRAPSATEGWTSTLPRAAQRITEWLKKPWVEPVMAGCVTFVSLLLFAY